MPALSRSAWSGSSSNPVTAPCLAASARFGLRASAHQGEHRRHRHPPPGVIRALVFLHTKKPHETEVSHEALNYMCGGGERGLLTVRSYWRQDRRFPRTFVLSDGFLLRELYPHTKVSALGVRATFLPARVYRALTCEG